MADENQMRSVSEKGENRVEDRHSHKVELRGLVIGADAREAEGGVDIIDCFP